MCAGVSPTGAACASSPRRGLQGTRVKAARAPEGPILASVAGGWGTATVPWPCPPRPRAAHSVPPAPQPDLAAAEVMGVCTCRGCPFVFSGRHTRSSSGGPSTRGPAGAGRSSPCGPGLPPPCHPDPPVGRPERALAWQVLPSAGVTARGHGRALLAAMKLLTALASVNQGICTGRRTAQRLYEIESITKLKGRHKYYMELLDQRRHQVRGWRGAGGQHRREGGDPGVRTSLCRKAGRSQSPPWAPPPPGCPLCGLHSMHGRRW